MTKKLEQRKKRKEKKRKENGKEEERWERNHLFHADREKELAGDVSCPLGVKKDM